VDALQWYAHHHVREELGGWARQAAALPEATPLAFGVASVMAMLAGDYESSIQLGRAGIEGAEHPTGADTYNCWQGSATSKWFGGSMDQAYDEAQQMLVAAAARDSVFDLVSALAVLGLMAGLAAPSTVSDVAARARSLKLPLANPALDAWVDCTIAPGEFASGDRTGAFGAWRRAQAAGSIASSFVEAVATMSLASVAQSRHSDLEPDAAYRDAIDRLLALRAWPHLWIAVESLATYWLDAGRNEQAAVLIGYLDANGRRSVNLARRRAVAAARLAELPQSTAWQARGRGLDRDAVLAYVRKQLEPSTG
jgi:hypothetical protein